MPDNPSFKNHKIVQIGIIVSDVEKAAQAYASLFGLEKPEWVMTEPAEQAQTRYHGRQTPARAKLAFFQFDNLTIELIEPVGEPSTWKEFLDNHGPGMHHIAFDVKDIDNQIALLEGMGARLIQQGRWTSGNGGRYAYMEGVPNIPVILELLESF